VIELLTPLGPTGLLAVNKPAGMLVIPGRETEPGTSLRERLAAQLGREVWVVHRLDRETSGVMVFALDAATHRAASMAFEAGEAKKRYVALVVGRVEHPLDLQFPLIEARKRRMKIAPIGTVGAKEARTLVRPRQLFEASALVECEPLTGRQHQIRVHLTAAGHPLLVDHQYGNKHPLTLGTATLARTPLHAESLEIPSLQFAASAPLATDLVEFIAQLR
jgi:RluA family pseudouridine synthase